MTRPEGAALVVALRVIAVPTVLVYSDDAAVRERVRIAVGRHPDRELGPLTYLEAADAPAVTEHVSKADLVVLDGESQPAGGLGVSRQLKAELDDCPPVIVLVARRDDRWLGRWSNADEVLPQPLDVAAITEAVVRLLKARMSREVVPVSRGLFGFVRRGR